MDPRIHAEYKVVNNVKTLCEKLASAYKSKLKLKIFENMENLWSVNLEDCGDVDNYLSPIDRNNKECNLCAVPIAPSSADTNAANTDASAKRIAKMSEQQHIVYLLHGRPRNDKWEVSLDPMMNHNGMRTAHSMRLSPRPSKWKLQS
jgi:hypothetical protein